MNIGRPPRHLSVIRHWCARLVAVAELELYIGNTASKSSVSGKFTFFPVFCSGSCAKIGPKHCTEDEHIWIDNLLEHLGETAEMSCCQVHSMGCLMAMVVVMPHLSLERTSLSLLEDCYFPFVWTRQLGVRL